MGLRKFPRGLATQHLGAEDCKQDDDRNTRQGPGGNDWAPSEQQQQQQRQHAEGYVGPVAEIGGHQAP
jgi:hypothetical protein